MSKRAVIYARVSTDMQRDNYSIPTQIADCKHFADDKRYTLLGNQYINPVNGRDAEIGNGAIPAYVDDYTSRELSRPGLDAAMAFLEAYGFDILIVHAIDRLARDPYIRQTLERELNSRGARVEYVLGSYEETPEGEVRKDLDATFAKWENAKRLERCNRGKKRKAESGKFVAGRVAYGYALNVEVFGGLEIIPEQAEVVRNIYRLYVEERMSIRAIVRHLDDFGYSPSRKGTAWAKTTVNRILDNSTYAGYFYYNKFKRLDLKRIELRPRHEWIRIECQAIVDPEIYEKAQIIKDQNRVRSRKQVSRFYMLSGMVICSECERPYLSQTLLPSVTPAPEGRQHRKHESQCYRHRLRAGHCLNRQISAKLLENIVWEKALNILKDPDALIEGYNQSLEQQAITFQKKRNLIATLDQNLLKIRAKKQNLNAAYLDPDIEMSKQEFLEYKGKLEEETKIIEEDLAIKRREMDNVPLPADVEILKKFAAEIVRGIEPIEKLSRQKKREILQIMHVTALISPEGDVKLDGWFNVAEQQEKDGLSTSSSARYARQPQPLRERV